MPQLLITKSLQNETRSIHHRIGGFLPAIPVTIISITSGRKLRRYQLANDRRSGAFPLLSGQNNKECINTP